MVNQTGSYEDTGDALAEFLEVLRLPAPELSCYEDAAEAVKREYRASTRWKRLVCLRVEPIAAPAGDGLFVLSVGHTLEFDWTWEGAVAFRPISISDFLKDPAFIEQHVDDPEVTTALWGGEVVEVDETRGQLFVKVDDPTSPPRKGVFYVRPFAFLAALNAVYEKPTADDLRRIPELNKRLHTARGGVHPLRYPEVQSSDQDFAAIWAHSWSILWGPPGMGKASKIGRQVAGLVMDSDERVLVVSTTNKATDAVGLSIGESTKARCVEELKQGRF